MLGSGSALLLARNAAIGQTILRHYVGHRTRHIMDQHTFVVCKTTKIDTWCVTLLRFKIDTGADLAVISEETRLAMRNKPELQPTMINLNNVGGQVKAFAKFNATTRHKQAVYRFDVIVISGDTSNLARDVSVNMGLVKRLDQICWSKPASIGLTKTDTLKLTTGFEPFF